MKNNIICKFLSSLPIILVALYFIPFLGICLILFRFFMFSYKNRILTSVFITLCGILILIPKGINLILNVIKFDINKISYFNNIIESRLYNVTFINYSKSLICIGVILLILLFVCQNIFNNVISKLSSSVKNYIDKTEKRNAEIVQKNDLEIKIRQEKAKNTSYVKCPSCGADNLISGKFDTCKYCRKQLENKNYKV